MNNAPMHHWARCRGLLSLNITEGLKVCRRKDKYFLEDMIRQGPEEFTLYSAPLLKSSCPINASTSRAHHETTNPNIICLTRLLSRSSTSRNDLPVTTNPLKAPLTCITTMALRTP